MNFSNTQKPSYIPILNFTKKNINNGYFIRNYHLLPDVTPKVESYAGRIYLTTPRSFWIHVTINQEVWYTYYSCTRHVGLRFVNIDIRTICLQDTSKKLVK